MASPLLGIPKIVGKAFKGVFFDAVLTRSIPGTGPAYDPGPPTIQSFPCKAMRTEYSAGARGQGLVGASDMKVLILATSLGTTPQQLDKIEISAQALSGHIAVGDPNMVKPVKTDPAQAVWECRVVT